MNCNAAYCEPSLAQRAPPAPPGAAKALGIPLPLSPLGRADEVFGQIARCRRLARLCRLRAVQEVVSYLGYTRSCRHVVATAARDPIRTLGNYPVAESFRYLLTDPT